jgi:oxygen-independent coproporphyrinogen-3 oxidase
MGDSQIPWSEITPKLLYRYSGPAPRYTSYPTAPEWSEAFGPGEYADALAAADKSPDDPLSIYVHIPYCKERCLYCGCASWLARSIGDYDKYLDALQNEADQVSRYLIDRRIFSRLHMGGGTPTTLDSPRLERLFGIITGCFRAVDKAEIAIEINPAVTSLEQIETLARLGFNRISMGVQDFTKEVQETVGRIQSVELTRNTFEKARAVGFSGINIDLMYGLPRQRPGTWRKNVETAIEMGPDRLAVFGYAHVPWMRPHQKAFNEAELPDTSLRFELFKIAHGMLVDAGYVYIGMDHFAKHEDELAKALKERRLWRNFQGYTVDEASALIGLGVTAISDLAGSFAQNRPSLEGYLDKTESKRLATYRGMSTSDEDRLRRHVITNLMCNLKIDVQEVEELFGIDFWRTFSFERKGLSELEKDGLAEFDDRVINVTPVGRIFVRHVGMVFDTYVRNQSIDGPRFSKTV